MLTTCLTAHPFVCMVQSVFFPALTPLAHPVKQQKHHSGAELTAAYEN